MLTTLGLSNTGLRGGFMMKGKGLDRIRTKIKMYTLTRSQVLETQWEVKEPIWDGPPQHKKAEEVLR